MSEGKNRDPISPLGFFIGTDKSFPDMLPPIRPPPLPAASLWPEVSHMNLPKPVSYHDQLRLI